MYFSKAEILINLLKTYILFKISVNYEIINDFLIFSYAGRPTAASPATGSKAQHLKELAALMDDSLSL